MSEFKTKIDDFFENLIAEDKASGFACEMSCNLPEQGMEPVDITGDEYSMEDVTGFFGADTVSVKVVPVEDCSGGGEHELVLEFADKLSPQVEFVRIFFDKTATDFDGDSFETEFQDFEFVKPVTKEVTVFETEEGAGEALVRSPGHVKTSEGSAARVVATMEEIEACRAERSPQWNIAFEALRDFRLSNIVDEDGHGYPIVDLMTRDGVSIADGEMELIALTDEVMLALYPRPGTN